jgi:hypothetical protein
MANPQNQPTPAAPESAPAKVPLTLEALMERIERAEAENAALKEKLEAVPSGLPLTPEQIAALQADAMAAGLPGNQVRPTMGQLHKATGKEIFNGNRPTGRAG